MSWSREQCEVLIDEYQRHSCLYAVKSAQYKNKHSRQNALQQIQAVLQPLKPSVTINDIKLKFNGLKNNFLTEYKKWNRSRRSGAGDEDGDGIYKPTIWYFNRMFFLLEHVEVRQAVDSLIAEDDTPQVGDEEIVTSEYYVTEDGSLNDITNTLDTGSSQVRDSQLNSPNLSRPISPVKDVDGATPSKRLQFQKKRKRETIEDNVMREASSALASISSTMQQSFVQNVDEDEALAQFIVSKLKRITDTSIRLQTEEKIVHTLFDALKKCNNL
ncbi:hypothetical protein PPYR_01397 [Photinus pyralis]|uniref:MADF domain-containing protein n=1 Tax=Photinus pyralis TaxID=7054 RepID=A0A5N4B487_PHOPY|nr:uncharacterized protein LOC116159089 [Photinus pyralis]XP_031328332.1 uncharacterized protein LOC116159493 [Photinus pyralis]XP_031328878.1 uncharacterized protein LOC116159919 [Photinus pyralis]XP_031332171.1 uncharacterized protein LOC116162653 [Photinus pyralis]KAB0804427.1 hypothetical protein PPYR_01397 [Photinus pyralis]